MPSDQEMPHQLTSEMRNTLRSLIRKESAVHNSNTLKALVSRGLVNVDSNLTIDGWKESISLLPLKEQCSALGISYEAIPNIKDSGRPEIAALKYFENMGFIGSSCEGGGILLLIRATALDKLAELNTFKSRDDACTRFTEAQLSIHKSSSQEILAVIRSATLAKTIEHFKEIFKSPFVQDCYPGLSPQIIEALFLSLGPNTIASIAEAMMEDSFGYRTGWPDLTLTNGKEMLWAEVKTSDRLHRSQIATISRMKPLLPGYICVAHLV